MATLLPDKIQIKNNPTRPVIDAELVEVDSSGFSKNLSVFDDTLQKALNTIDVIEAFGSGVVYMEFEDETARDAYFVANPAELVDELIIAITGTPNGENLQLYNHSGNHTIEAYELNAIHNFSGVAVAYLPPALVPGRWVYCKKNSASSLTITPDGTDLIADENSSFVNNSTELFDFVMLVVEEEGVWGVYETRGTWTRA